MYLFEFTWTKRDDKRSSKLLVQISGNSALIYSNKGAVPIKGNRNRTWEVLGFMSSSISAGCLSHASLLANYFHNVFIGGMLFADIFYWCYVAGSVFNTIYLLFSYLYSKFTLFMFICESLFDFLTDIAIGYTVFFYHLLFRWIIENCFYWSWTPVKSISIYIVIQLIKYFIFKDVY